MRIREMWRWTWRGGLGLAGFGIAYVSIFELPRVI